MSSQIPPSQPSPIPTPLDNLVKEAQQAGKTLKDLDKKSIGTEQDRKNFNTISKNFNDLSSRVENQVQTILGSLESKKLDTNDLKTLGLISNQLQDLNYEVGNLNNKIEKIEKQPTKGFFKWISQKIFGKTTILKLHSFPKVPELSTSLQNIRKADLEAALAKRGVPPLASDLSAIERSLQNLVSTTITQIAGTWLAAKGADDQEIVIVIVDKEVEKKYREVTILITPEGYKLVDDASSKMPSELKTYDSLQALFGDDAFPKPELNEPTLKQSLDKIKYEETKTELTRLSDTSIEQLSETYQKESRRKLLETDLPQLYSLMAPNFDGVSILHYGANSRLEIRITDDGTLETTRQGDADAWKNTYANFEELKKTLGLTRTYKEALIPYRLQELQKSPFFVTDCNTENQAIERLNEISKQLPLFPKPMPSCILWKDSRGLVYLSTVDSNSTIEHCKIDYTHTPSIFSVRRGEKDEITLSIEDYINQRQLGFSSQDIQKMQARCAELQDGFGTAIVHRENDIETFKEAELRRFAFDLGRKANGTTILVIDDLNQLWLKRINDKGEIKKHKLEIYPDGFILSIAPDESSLKVSGYSIIKE